jgi:hypothetical protein
LRGAVLRHNKDVLLREQIARGQPIRNFNRHIILSFASFLPRTETRRARFANGFLQISGLQRHFERSFFGIKKPPSGLRIPHKSRIAGRSRRRPKLIWKVARYKDESSQQAGAGYLLDRGDSYFFYKILETRCRRIRLLRVHSHSHGAPALGVN